jgi:hypothetical protein
MDAMKNYFGWQKWPVLALPVWLVLANCQTPAQTADAVLPAAPVSSNRFLFIVDTSSSMKNHKHDEQKVMAQILLSSANGQLRPGDTLGQWTYNKDVYAEFPLKTWGTGPVEEMVWTFTNFINNQRYEGPSHLEKALVEMHHVMRSSDIITVVILHNGRGKITGTPFDEAINAECAASFKETGDKSLPVTVVLQTRGGDVMSYKVAFYPWTVSIPEIPVPPPAPKAVITQNLPPTPPAPAKILPNLILQGASPKENYITGVPEVSQVSPQTRTENQVAIEPSIPSTQPPAAIKAQTPQQVSVEVTPATAISRVNPPDSSTNQTVEQAVANPVTNAVSPKTEALAPAVLPTTVVQPNNPAGSSKGSNHLVMDLLMVVGAFACGILFTLKVIRARQLATPSLITRSMNERRR